MPNLRSKIFQNFFMYRVLWTLNFSQWGQGTNFFGHIKFEVKIFLEFFPLPSTVDTYFSEVGLGQLFLVMPNLRPNNFLEFFPLPSAVFHLQSAPDSEFFRAGVWAPNFFRGGVWTNIFWLCQIWDLTIFWNFFLYQVLWTEFLRGGV